MQFVFHALAKSGLPYSMLLKTAKETKGGSTDLQVILCSLDLQ